MKAIYILVLLVLSMTLAIGCSNVNSKSVDMNAIREVAWNSISNQDKQQLNLVWKNAEVTKIKFDEMINEYSIPEGAEPKEIENLYKVTFDKNHVIFVDGNTKKVVGTISKE
ncbi:hypothetical protein GZH47_00015 [Paenibacillus rhizovicinus]|uniref:Uncharacterized protein n=1 Tax=Paenibacillus rhizovicinus TaxID=2704463 RepID=A0A6C0NT38_9BACL|nr:hypothetical protein [Paenibacillus rhizovicinus]QHW29369.1 hypothetical protein GZH47_00015 [Paenibacillus rhizovicinus]